MADLSCKFTRADIETLIESMGDWEMVGNHEFHIMSMIRSAPMPPEDHEAYEFMKQLKDTFRNREKDIMASRAVRQETAILLKAKLILIRKDLAIDTLFEMSTMPETQTAQKPPQENFYDSKPKDKSDPVQGKVAENYKIKLELAERFIQELGVQKYYEKFLKEQNSGEEVVQK